MYKTSAIVVALCLFLVSPPLLAQFETSPYVFQIRCVFNNDKKPAETEWQTGFSVAGMKGIITALHGVIKCFLNGKITAVASGGERSMFDVRIESADIANDVALLSPASRNIDNGLPIAKCDSNSCINYPKPYYVLGHPRGITSQVLTEVKIRPHFEPLENWLTAVEVTVNVKNEVNVKDEMKDRGSPAITIQVFNVEGHLLHGHSGAPIINEKNEVIGVVNGGLEDGKVEIAWAIPYKNLQLKEVSVIASQLTDLKSKSIPKLLTFFGSSSSDVLNLKILLVNPTQSSPTMENAISQAVFKDRSASYFLPISQSNSSENVIIGIDNEVENNENVVVELARGKLNAPLSSRDEQYQQYQFEVSNKEGVWVLSLDKASWISDKLKDFTERVIEEVKNYRSGGGDPVKIEKKHWDNFTEKAGRHMAAGASEEFKRLSMTFLILK